MKFSKIISTLCLLLLAGCSVKSWQGQTTVKQSTKYPNATEISYFKPDSKLYDQQTLNKIAVSNRITIVTNSRYVSPIVIEKWLRQQGAKGMIDFSRRGVCVACSETTAYLIP